MTKQRVAIFGGLGAGAVVAQSIDALAASGRFEFVGFLNDTLPVSETVHGAPVLGKFSAWRELASDVTFVAPLHKAKEMEARMRLINALGVPPARWATIVDPRSAVAADARIEGGSFVGPFATVGPGAQLGMHNVVRAGAHVSHDCTLGDFVCVGIASVVCGFSSAGDGAYIAPRAVVRDRCRIGRLAVVGLGAVVVKDVPDFAHVVGSPARALEPAVRGLVDDDSE
jgi:acetyltransferase EpsM